MAHRHPPHGSVPGYPTGHIPPPNAPGYPHGYQPPPGYPQPHYPPAPSYPQAPPPPHGAVPHHGHGHDHGHKGKGGPPAPPVLYFHICSKLNGLVLDIQAGSQAPGTKVVTWTKKTPPSDNQLWYEDPSVGAIRSKSHGFCLEVTGDSLVVNPYTQGNRNQLWFLSGDRIKNKKDPSKVLDIAQSQTEPGARICAYKNNGTKNQLWKFEYQKTGHMPPPGCAPPVVAPAPRYFYIRSEMNNKVLAISKGSQPNGADVITHALLKRDEQLWYMDDNGSLRSKKKNLAVDTSSGQANLQPHRIGNQNQLWTISGNRIINMAKPGEVLDIKQKRDADGAFIIPYQYSGGSNQHWHVEFI